MREVFVAVFRLTGDAPDLMSALSPEENARARRITNATARHHWALGRAALRLVLGRALSRAPAELALVTTEDGKPALADAALQFSVSRSDAWFAVALSQRGVGIDIETRSLPARRDTDALFLTPAERDELWSAEPMLQSDLRRRLWTRKEASLKALGSGLRHDPRLVHVGADPAPTRQLEIAGKTLTLTDLAPSLALAVVD